jgi:vacuolar-type H+-ATPase subunit E/Vma4
MGIQDIVRLIEREATDEADRLVADARAQAASIVEAAEAAAQARVTAACERAEPSIQGEAARRVNAARLHLLEGRAEAAARQIDDVMLAAEAALKDITIAADGRRWEEALSRLTVAAVEAVGPGAIVRVRARDASLVAAVVEAHGGHVEPLTEPDAGPGIRAVAADGRIEVDATLHTRLRRARTMLAEDIGTTLDLEA